MLPNRYTVFLQSALLATLLAASGCQTAPPVQEMSDARQAITAAREAGAAQHASNDLSAALSLIESAERSISSRRYAEARRDAVQAKTRALEALRRSELEQEQDP